MKKLILISVLVGLMATLSLAGPTFKFTHSELLGLVEVYEDPTGQSLNLVTDDATIYGSNTKTMQGEVGYIGMLSDIGDPSPWSEIWIGDDGRDLTLLDDYKLTLHNDNDDLWKVRLFVMPTDHTDTIYSGDWVNLNQGESVSLSIDVSGQTTVASVGFIIGADRDVDAFHISTTAPLPVPGAILLGSIGICLVGWLRRRGRI